MCPGGWTYGKFLNIIFGTTDLQCNIKMAGASLVESFEGELGMGPGQESHMLWGKDAKCVKSPPFGPGKGERSFCDL